MSILQHTIWLQNLQTKIIRRTIMVRVEINRLEFLTWDVPNDYMQELIDWLNTHAKKVPTTDLEQDIPYEEDVRTEEEWHEQYRSKIPDL